MTERADRILLILSFLGFPALLVEYGVYFWIHGWKT